MDDVIALCTLKHILFLPFFNPLFGLFRKFESLFYSPPGVAPLYPNYSSNNFHIMQDVFSESDDLIDCTPLEKGKPLSLPQAGLFAAAREVECVVRTKVNLNAKDIPS
jgi:hypothetical protein